MQQSLHGAWDSPKKHEITLSRLAACSWATKASWRRSAGCSSQARTNASNSAIACCRSPGGSVASGPGTGGVDLSQRHCVSNRTSQTSLSQRHWNRTPTLQIGLQQASGPGTGGVDLSQRHCIGTRTSQTCQNRPRQLLGRAACRSVLKQC